MVLELEAEWGENVETGTDSTVVLIKAPELKSSEDVKASVFLT